LITEALTKLRAALPFPLLGFDTDNDSVFMNETVIAHCCTHNIEQTRSRAYQKNDQAWIEQKNGSVVRKLTGYGRPYRLRAPGKAPRLSHRRPSLPEGPPRHRALAGPPRWWAMRAMCRGRNDVAPRQWAVHGPAASRGSDARRKSDRRPVRSRCLSDFFARLALGQIRPLWVTPGCCEVVCLL